MNDNKAETGILIHGFAAAHAATAAILSQTLVGDEAALRFLTGTMIVAIAKMNQVHWTMGQALKFLGLFFGKYVGIRGATLFIKWVPGIGNAANATVTFSVTEILGWATYLFVRGHDVSDVEDMTTEDCDALWKQAKALRDSEAEESKALYRNMTEKDRNEYEAILRELDKDLPEETREYFTDRIAAIVQKYKEN